MTWRASGATCSSSIATRKTSAPAAEDHINARLQDNARYSLLRPRPALNAAAGAILGLILGGVLVLVLEYLESSIVRNSDDMERATGISVLASIPNAEG